MTLIVQSVLSSEPVKFRANRSKQLIRTTPHELLCIGDAISSRDLRNLYELNIDAVVDLAANELPAQLGRDHIYCRFPLHDDGSNSQELLTLAVECVVTLLAARKRTLVACSAGMSRSPVISAAAVAVHTGAPLQSCLAQIVSHAPHDVSAPLLASVADALSNFSNRS